MSEVHAFCPNHGCPQCVEMRWPIPRPLIEDSFMIIRTRVSVSRKYAAAEKTVGGIMYSVLSPDGTSARSCFEIPKVWDARDGLCPDVWQTYCFVIEPENFRNAQGGTLSVWFCTLSQSTGPVLYVDEFHRQILTGGAAQPVKDGVFKEEDCPV